MYISCESCPCGDDGFWVEPDSEGNAQQVQCEFCYTVPWSVFNLKCIQEQFNNKNTPDTYADIDANEIPF